MDYFEAFEKIKKSLAGISAPKTEQPFAVQIRLTDEDCAGTLYMLLDNGKLSIEPYDYFDNDADILTNFSTLTGIISGSVDFKKAVSEKLISISGNSEALADIFSKLKKDKPKRKVTKKTEGKKMEGKKMADDKKKPQTETIKDVVEKETKPKK